MTNPWIFILSLLFVIKGSVSVFFPKIMDRFTNYMASLSDQYIRFLGLAFLSVGLFFNVCGFMINKWAFVLGFLMIVEGMLCAFLPKTTKRLIQWALSLSVSHIRLLGGATLIVGILLLFFSL